MKYNLRSKLIKTGGVYLGFYTLRGRKFPNGNFRTSVFCEAKTQIVGGTSVPRQAYHAVKLLERVRQRADPVDQADLLRLAAGNDRTDVGSQLSGLAH